MSSSVEVGGMREVVLLVVVRATVVSGLWRSGDEGGEGEGIDMTGGIEASTSAMFSMGEIGV